MAGTIESVGQDVADLKPGDEVYGTCDGSFAEYVRAQRPPCLPPSRRTCPLSRRPRYQFLGSPPCRLCVTGPRCKRARRYWSSGRPGGVGSFAVQIAKAFGAEVTGVCSTAKVDLVRSLGADYVVDYTSEDLADGENRYDAIVDTGGNRRLSDLRRALTPRGRLVIVGGETDGRWLGGADRLLRAPLSLRS